MVRKHHCRHVWLICSLLGAASSAQSPEVRDIMTNSRRGNCIICHHVPLSGVPSNAYGNIGPSLDHVGARLGPAQIRRQIVDPRGISSNSVMPAYGSTRGLYRVQRHYVGTPILSDAEIEQIVAYLAALR